MISKLCVVSATTLLPCWVGCVCTLSAPGASLAPDTGVAGRVLAHFLRGLSLPAGSGRGRPCEALLPKLRPPTSPHSETSVFSLWAILQHKQKRERRMKTQKVTGRPLSNRQVQIPRPQQCRGRTHNLVRARVCACVRAQPEDAGPSGTCSGAVQRPPVPPPLQSQGEAGPPLRFTRVQPLHAALGPQPVEKPRGPAWAPGSSQQGSLSPVPWDKAILHPPRSPSAVRAGPGPLAGDTAHPLGPLRGEAQHTVRTPQCPRPAPVWCRHGPR